MDNTITIPYEAIQAYRRKTFHMAPEQRLQNSEQAVEFVNRLGFTFFWPISGYTYPSLWAAVAGERPVADEHDDPGHVTWGWKDQLLGGEAWYYAKVLRKKATMISFELAPYFYALSENYGAPDEDYLTIYEQGHLTQEAKAVYEAILQEGPLDTLALRRAARLTSKNSEGRFNKALVDLQADFKLCPVGISEAGGWRYAFIYAITARHYPQIAEQSRWIGERKARKTLAQRYFAALGAAPLKELRRLFGWKPAEAQRAVDDLVEEGSVQAGVRVENWPGEWIVWREMLSRD